MRPGDRVSGRFFIERLAGTGGMGKVYRARDEQAGGTPVAIKVLDHTGGVRVERFAREAQILAELRHPGIVRYLAHGASDDGEAYLAMEWLDGVDLRAYLKDERMALGDAITLAHAVADALGAAHRAGVVHRDVKPSNVYLVPSTDGPPRVKLLDFGIARRRHAPTSVTHTGARVGTPRYMAPEQVRGARDVGPRADVFSLGCVLYEAITGRPAFPGADEMAVLAKILLDEPVRPSELRFAVPPALDALLGRMMAKDAALRPADGAMVAAELAALTAMTPLAQPPRRAVTGTESLSRHEQRLLSVVLVRPTEAFRRDVSTQPDETKALEHADLTDELRRVGRKHGAEVEPLANGTFVVVLSHAGAAAGAAVTDQTGQAARCALSVRDLAKGLRVALATGRGLVTGNLPVGEVIDRAATLVRRLGRRPVTESSVAVDDVTARLLDPRFELEVLEGSDGGDREPLRLLHREREASGGARRLLGRPSPRVGRERELAQLHGYFDECADDPRAHAVLITGPPGVGKTRLVTELLTELSAREQPHVALFGRGDPLRMDQRASLLAMALRDAADIREDDDAQARREKLRARVAHVLPDERGQATAAFLGELAGVPFPDDGPEPWAVQLRAAHQDPALMSDQLRLAWEAFLAASCARGPTILVLDDMHWADVSTVRLVDGALRALARRPLFVIALGRPAVADRFPRLWAERGVSELPLAPLPRRAAEKLVREVLGNRATDAVVTRVCDRAEGNALYLEELIRAEVAGAGGALPDTVLAMLQARVEALETEARLVLRAASVFGERFARGGVLALIGSALAAERVDDWLDELCEREVLFCEDLPHVGAPGAGHGHDRDHERRYAFAHALLAEAAYATLTNADRLLGHRLAAGWLTRGPAPEAVVIAEHFQRGGAPARAIEWFRRAGEQALEAADTAGALDRVERGIASGASGAALGELYEVRAAALAWRGQMRLCAEAAEQALALLPVGSPRWCTAAAEATAAAASLGEESTLRALAAKLAPLVDRPAPLERHIVLAGARVAADLYLAGLSVLADALLEKARRGAGALPDGDPAVRAVLERALELRASYRGDAVHSLVHALGAAAAFEAAGNHRYGAIEKINVGFGHGELGDLAAAEAELRGGISAAESLGLGNIAALGLQNLGIVLLHSGRFAEAEEVERKALAELVANGDRRAEAATRAALAQIFAAQGRLPDAEREARRAAALATNVEPVLALALAVLARVLVAAGRVDQAVEAARRASALVDRLGGLDEGDALVGLALAEALHAAGDLAGARAAIGAAHDRALHRAKALDPERRDRFLRHAPFVARTLELHAALG